MSRAPVFEDTGAPAFVAPAGSIHIDSSTKAVYVNTDGLATGWVVVASVFGNDYQTRFSLGRSTRASGSFGAVAKVELITPALTGNYRLGWTSLIDTDGAQGKFRIFNVTDAVEIGGVMIFKPGDSAQREDWSGVSPDDIVFAGAAKTFRMQFADNEGGGHTVGIQQARLEFFRVS